MIDLPKKVFELDQKIRYCALLDKLGNTTSGGMRPNLQSLEPQNQTVQFDLQLALIRGMIETGQRYLGRTSYVIIHREKLMLLLLPREDGGSVLVTMEPDFPLENLEALMKAIDDIWADKMRDSKQQAEM